MSAVGQKLLHGLKNFVVDSSPTRLIGLLWTAARGRFWFGLDSFGVMAVARATIEFPVARANYRSGL